MTEPKFDFWKPATGKESPKNRVKGGKEVGSSAGDLDALKKSIIRPDFRKKALEKHQLYGVNQDFFNKPENKYLKDILEYRLGIDIDRPGQQVNSDVFMSALAHFQVEHAAEIPYDRDGWFAPSVPGKGPTPTWIAMFGDVSNPWKIPASKSESGDKSPEKSKNVYRTIPIPEKLSPEDLVEWKKDVDALWVIDGLKNISYNRDTNHFVFNLTGVEWLREDFEGKISPEGRRAAMIDWVTDQNIQYLLSQENLKNPADRTTLPGITYNEKRNVYVYLGQEKKRGYLTLSELRAWQDECVPKYIISTLGGAKLKSMYSEWEKAKGIFTFSHGVNVLLPFFDPFTTKWTSLDGDVVKHSPAGVNTTWYAYQKIFEQIQANGGVPPVSMLPQVPPIAENAALGISHNMEHGEVFRQLLTLDKDTLEKQKTALIAGSRENPLIYIFDMALSVKSASEYASKMPSFSVDNYTPDTHPLQLALAETKKQQVLFDTAKDNLQWSWNTSGLVRHADWGEPIQKQRNLIENTMAQMENIGHQRQTNRTFLEQKITSLTEAIKKESELPNPDQIVLEKLNMEKSIYESASSMNLDVDQTRMASAERDKQLKIFPQHSDINPSLDVPFTLSQALILRIKSAVLSDSTVSDGMVKVENLPLDKSGNPDYSDLMAYFSYAVTEKPPGYVRLSPGDYGTFMSFLDSWKKNPKTFNDGIDSFALKDGEMGQFLQGSVGIYLFPQ